MQGKWQEKDKKNGWSRCCSLRLSEHAESRGKMKGAKLFPLFLKKKYKTRIYLISFYIRCYLLHI